MQDKVNDRMHQRMGAHMARRRVDTTKMETITPSRNLTEVRQGVHYHAIDFLEREGLYITLSKNSQDGICQRDFLLKL